MPTLHRCRPNAAVATATAARRVIVDQRNAALRRGVRDHADTGGTCTSARTRSNVELKVEPRPGPEHGVQRGDNGARAPDDGEARTRSREQMARIVRGRILSAEEQEFVLAAYYRNEATPYTASI